MRARGFSLVETVMAALVLAVGVLALIGTESAATHLAAGAQLRSRAVEAAASALDRPACSPTSGLLAALAPVDVSIPIAGQRAITVQRYVLCAAP